MDVVSRVQDFCLDAESLKQNSSPTMRPLTQGGGLEITEWQVFLNLGIPHHHLAIEDKTTAIKQFYLGGRSANYTHSVSCG